eukprot:CAMPEP_0119409080 /NCGR_PEP_ID=MMETSP1335-20130426/2457_1 /TAXON_ID=259385 /ORGANISM="Chrysoculter rhomboideus, Strain RCC1486" /LENGTH=252 /DNA_ID=CAMNT_0007433403 /DNA_START=55 /DNA_END=814 /DNA_ORIENTATION=+
MPPSDYPGQKRAAAQSGQRSGRELEVASLHLRRHLLVDQRLPPLVVNVRSLARQEAVAAEEAVVHLNAVERGVDKERHRERAQLRVPTHLKPAKPLAPAHRVGKQQQCVIGKVELNERAKLPDLIRQAGKSVFRRCEQRKPAERANLGRQLGQYVRVEVQLLQPRAPADLARKFGELVVPHIKHLQFHELTYRWVQLGQLVVRQREHRQPLAKLAHAWTDSADGVGVQVQGAERTERQHAVRNLGQRWDLLL